MSNRLNRAAREALERQDAALLKQPLALADDGRSSAAHIRQMVKLLRSTRSASPCSDAMAYMYDLYERTMEPQILPQTRRLTACKKGCSHCCVQPVSITAPEAFFLARVLKGRHDTIAALAEAGARIAATPKTQRLFNLRCPMLQDQACSVYEARPLNCRNFVSLDVNACISRYVMMGNGFVTRPDEYTMVNNSCRMVLYAAFGLVGRRNFSENYEMKAALAHVLTLGDDAEARWLKGEDVMAGVDLIDEPQTMFHWHIERLIAAMRPTV